MMSASSRSKMVKDEILVILKYSIPLVITNVLMFAADAQVIMFSGTISKIRLDSIGLAFSLSNVFFSVLMGIGSACETLMSQYFGSNNKKMVGVILQRSIIVSGLASILLAGISLNIEHILLLLKQDPEIAKESGIFMLGYLPSHAARGFSLVVSRFIQCQGVTLPVAFTYVILNIFVAISQVLAVKVFHLDSFWVAFAHSSALWLGNGAMVAIIYLRKLHKDVWRGWSHHCLDDWGIFLKLSVGGAAMIFVEFSCFEVVTILSGTLGTTELGAQVVVNNFEVLSFMVPYSICLALSIRVGHALGSGNINQIFLTMKIGILLALASAINVGIIVGVSSYHVPRIYSQDHGVISMAGHVFRFFIVFHMFDSYQSVLQGVIRACGYQQWAAIINVIAYLIVQLPIAVCTMTLTPLGIMGGWIGLTVAVAMQGISFTLILVKTDWRKLSDDVRKRTVKDEDVKNKGRYFKIEEYEIKQDLLIAKKNCVEDNLSSRESRLCCLEEDKNHALDVDNEERRRRFENRKERKRENTKIDTCEHNYDEKVSFNGDDNVTCDDEEIMRIAKEEKKNKDDDYQNEENGDNAAERLIGRREKEGKICNDSDDGNEIVVADEKEEKEKEKTQKRHIYLQFLKIKLPVIICTFVFFIACLVARIIVQGKVNNVQTIT